jgi:hypothetical protein
VRLSPREKRPRTNPTKKKKYSDQQQKEMDCDDELHLAPNEKTQPIQWTERPTGALVAAGSLCPPQQQVITEIRTPFISASAAPEGVLISVMTRSWGVTLHIKYQQKISCVSGGHII